MPTLQDLIYQKAQALSSAERGKLPVEDEERAALADAAAVILWHQETRNELSKRMNWDDRQIDSFAFAIEEAAILKVDPQSRARIPIAIPGINKRDENNDHVFSFPPVAWKTVEPARTPNMSKAIRNAELAWNAWQFSDVAVDPYEQQLSLDLAGEYVGVAISQMPEEQRKQHFDPTTPAGIMGLVAQRRRAAASHIALDPYNRRAFGARHSDLLECFKLETPGIGNPLSPRLWVGTVSTTLAKRREPDPQAARTWQRPDANQFVGNLEFPYLDQLAKSEIFQTARSEPVVVAESFDDESFYRLPPDAKPIAKPFLKPSVEKLALGPADIVGRILDGEYELARQYPEAALEAVAATLWDPEIYAAVAAQRYYDQENASDFVGRADFDHKLYEEVYVIDRLVETTLDALYPTPPPPGQHFPSPRLVPGLSRFEANSNPDERKFIGEVPVSYDRAYRKADSTEAEIADAREWLNSAVAAFDIADGAQSEAETISYLKVAALYMSGADKLLGPNGRALLFESPAARKAALFNYSLIRLSHAMNTLQVLDTKLLDEPIHAPREGRSIGGGWDEHVRNAIRIATGPRQIPADVRAHLAVKAHELAGDKTAELVAPYSTWLEQRAKAKDLAKRVGELVKDSPAEKQPSARQAQAAIATQMSERYELIGRAISQWEGRAPSATDRGSQVISAVLFGGQPPKYELRPLMVLAADGIEHILRTGTAPDMPEAAAIWKIRQTYAQDNNHLPWDPRLPQVLNDLLVVIDADSTGVLRADYEKSVEQTAPEQTPPGPDSGPTL